MSIFQRIGNALARFMYGRNGICGLLLRSALLTRIFEALLFALMLFIFFRMFSKNLPKRQAENQRWLNWVWRRKSRSAGAKARHADKEHKYFTCKACKTICRVPAGKGSVIITCPKCGAQIKAKT